MIIHLSKPIDILSIMLGNSYFKSSILADSPFTYVLYRSQPTFVGCTSMLVLIFGLCGIVLISLVIWSQQGHLYIADPVA